MQQRVNLLDNKEQTIQFRQLERKAGRNQDVVDHPRGLKDDIANACAGSCVLAARVDSYRLPPPSYGISETVETEAEKMDREAKVWLLGIKKKMPKNDHPDNLDMDALEAEMMDGLEKEIAAEIRKESSKDVQFRRGWEDWKHPLVEQKLFRWSGVERLQHRRYRLYLWRPGAYGLALEDRTVQDTSKVQEEAGEAHSENAILILFNVTNKKFVRFF